MQPSINWGKQDWHRGGSVFYSTLLLISRSVQSRLGEIIMEKSQETCLREKGLGGAIIEMTRTWNPDS